MAYRQWVKDNDVPTNPDAKGQQDYDMRGFWLGLQHQNPKAQSAVDPNDNRLHYPDYWKTPSHETFSNESQWAKPDSPGWTDDDKLVTPGGPVLYDDRAPKPKIPGFGGGGKVNADTADSGGEVLPADSDFDDR